MAKKLSDIEEFIRGKENDFIPFLKELLDAETFAFITALSKVDRLYLFSGIIRDYFLGIKDVRDVDLMIDTSKDISSIIQEYPHRRNSYGGYKVYINDTVIDLWHMEDTWALHNAQMVMGFELEKYIPTTAFFNFSSILFSFKKKSFIPTIHFLRFLRDKKIDYVFIPNASKALCVVNSIYYQDKLRLPLSNKLKTYLKLLNKRYSNEYIKVQKKHFGKIIYTRNEIKNRVEKMEIVKSKT